MCSCKHTQHTTQNSPDNILFSNMLSISLSIPYISFQSPSAPFHDKGSRISVVVQKTLFLLLIVWLRWFIDCFISETTPSLLQYLSAPFHRYYSTEVWFLYSVCVRVHHKIWRHRQYRHILYLYHIHRQLLFWGTVILSLCFCLCVVLNHSLFESLRIDDIYFFLCCIFCCSLCFIQKRFSNNFMDIPWRLLMDFCLPKQRLCIVWWIAIVMM